jgi:hypothetical protein
LCYNIFLEFLLDRHVLSSVLLFYNLVRVGLFIGNCKSLSTLFSLFKAKFTALSNNVLFSFISAGFDSQVASGKYFVWAVATKGQTKKRLAFYFS